MFRWDDLAVGAPQFFSKDDVVGGAVYVYINNKGKNWEKIVPVQLLGKKDSMFGHAVENIGDVNQDGYEGDIFIIYILQKCQLESVNKERKRYVNISYHHLE